jgi:hypothetical protein
LAERLEILRKRVPTNSVARSLAVTPASEGVDEGLQRMDAMRPFVSCAKRVAPGGPGGRDAAGKVTTLGRQNEEFKAAENGSMNAMAAACPQRLMDSPERYVRTGASNRYAIPLTGKPVRLFRLSEPDCP